MAEAINTCMQRRSQINQELRALALRRNTMSSKRKRSASAAARAWQLTADMRRAVLFTYEQSEWNLEPCVMFLRRVRASMRWPALREQDMHVLIETEFLQCDLDAQLEYKPILTSGDRWARLAVRLVQEYKIIAWGRDLNTRGVAPSTAWVVEKMRCYGDAAPKAVLKRTRFGRPNNMARMWASRFRKRWGAKIGRAKVVDDVAIDVLRHKVSFYEYSVIASCCGNGPEIGIALCDLKCAWSIWV